MAQELWATYSVKDHLTPRALAADIMLFDRLVFPVPETPAYSQDGTIEWKPNTTERARWDSAHWDPDSQKRLLDLLEPVVRKVSWDRSGPCHERYSAEAARLAALELPDWAFVATRSVLTQGLPAYVNGVAALGPAYRSVGEFEHELGIGSPDARRVLPGGALPTVLAWEFFAPDPNDTRLSDEELLKETVSFVTTDTEFRKHRTAFVEWQQKFLKDNTTTDKESVQRAVAEMREFLEQAKKAATKLKIRKVAQYAFQIAPSALGLAAAFAGVPDGIEVAAGGVFLSFGSIGVDQKLFKSAEQAQPIPAAFVRDARRHFGWK